MPNAQLKAELQDVLVGDELGDRFVYCSFVTDGAPYEDGPTFDPSDFLKWDKPFLQKVMKHAVFAIQRQGARPFLLRKPQFVESDWAYRVTMYGVRDA